MSYGTEELTGRLECFLTHTNQYVFMSSARVYSPCDSLVNEECPRLLDVCDDRDYLKTDEYALRKAQQENALRNCGRNNWTIVRPSITYNSERLQYAIGEKEDWLYRYLHEEKIVFPKNMGDTVTTMSRGDDVARAISLLVGNEKARGETVHIAGARAVTWSEINRIYRNVLVERFQREPDYMYIEDWKKLGKMLGRYYQLKYARSVNRSFDNAKLESLIGKIPFADPAEGLAECLNAFLDGQQSFGKGVWKTEACYNRITKETNASFAGREKLNYLIGRYTPYFDLRALKPPARTFVKP